jgi:hypothetical protein
MQYVALIYGSEAHWESLGDEERQALDDRHLELFGKDDRVLGGGKLQSTKTATTVRVRNGDRLPTDGPYAEVKEVLGGYIVLECDSIDEACRLAATFPAAKHHTAIEVRPVYVRDAEPVT